MKYLQGLCAFFTVLFVACGASGAIACQRPVIALDANGNGIAVWDVVQNNARYIVTNTLVGGVWGVPTTIAADATAFGQKVAVRANGADIQAVVVWTEGSNGITSLFGSMLSSAGADWTDIAQISGASEDIQTPQYDMVMNDNGSVLATWSSLDASNQQYIRSSTSKVGSANSWSAPETVSGFEKPTAPKASKKPSALVK